MQRGLEGRRIALIVCTDDNAVQRSAAVVRLAEETESAQVQHD